jgi:hypothetical protein
MCKTILAAVVVAALGVGGALAQTPAPPQKPACAAMDAGLKDGLEAWKSKADVAAAGAAGELAKAELKVGAAAKVALLSTPKVDYPVRPEKPGGSVSHGGLLAFTVSEPGTYRVALSTPAWIEVVKDGKAVPSGSFGHGPECTTIRKIVEFPLTAGAHLLELAANADATTDVLIVRKK